MLILRRITLVALIISLSLAAGTVRAAALKQGDRGESVRLLQEKLSSAGFFEGPATGYFGSITRRSVTAFQRAARIGVDGIAGPKTLALLNSRMAQVKTVAADDRDDEPAPAPKQTPPAAPVAPVPMPPATVPAPQNNYEVVAYYCQYHDNDMLSYESLKQHAAGAVDGIAVFLYSVTRNGDIVGGDPTRALALAKELGVKPLALVNNISGRSFNKDVVHRVLSDPKVRERAVNNILRMLKDNGFAGVNIDFEHVPTSDRNNYTTFVRLLVDKLKPEGLMVTLSVPAKKREDPNNSWSAPFDYPALGKLADRIMIMTYDQHWSTSVAGPISGVDWVEGMLKYAVATIPSEKIMMGLATYGYDWQIGSRRARAVPASKAVTISKSEGVQSLWCDVSQAPFYKYKEGKVQRVVYYEDSRSAAHKLELVKKYNLAGIAIWRLGYEDPQLWGVIKQSLRTIATPQ